MEASLRTSLDGVDLEVIEVSRLLRRRPHMMLLVLVDTVMRFSPHLVTRRRHLRDLMWRSPVLGRWLRRKVRRAVNAINADFTFQMQSLFDASTGLVPHFVYTDHTNLENRNYQVARGGAVLPRWALRREQRIYERASRVFVRSSNVGRSVVDDYGIPSASVVRIGAGATVRPTGQPTATPRVGRRMLFVGVDWERKGGPAAVEAVRHVRRKHPTARLTIVGASPDVDGSFCDVLGRVEPSQMSAHFAAAEVLLMPSVREPFGVAALEAMAHGIPVIANRVGALPEIVQDGVTGYLVDVNDVTEFAQRLDHLLSEPDLAATMGARGRQRVTDDFNWERVGRLAATTIREVVPQLPDEPTRSSRSPDLGRPS